MFDGPMVCVIDLQQHSHSEAISGSANTDTDCPCRPRPAVRCPFLPDHLGHEGH